MIAISQIHWIWERFRSTPIQGGLVRDRRPNDAIFLPRCCGRSDRERQSSQPGVLESLQEISSVGYVRDESCPLRPAVKHTWVFVVLALGAGKQGVRDGVRAKGRALKAAALLLCVQSDHHRTRRRLPILSVPIHHFGDAGLVDKTSGRFQTNGCPSFEITHTHEALLLLLLFIRHRNCIVPH